MAYTEMGVKIKTFKRLRDFRAGAEGNIPELKRAFGASKALWKGHDGFKAFVWSSGELQLSEDRSPAVWLAGAGANDTNTHD